MTLFCSKCLKFKDESSFSEVKPNALYQKCSECAVIILENKVNAKKKYPTKYSLEVIENKERLKNSIWCMSWRVCL